jgi:hypothetical protein
VPWSRRVLVRIVLLAMLVIVPAASCQRPADLGAELNTIVGPYRFSVVAWEACALLGVGCSDAPPLDGIAGLDDATALETFFTLAEAQRAVEEQMWIASEEGLAELWEHLDAIQAQRAALRSQVETTIARQVHDALDREGIWHPFQRYLALPLRFPPVGLRLDNPPTLLVISPRERIESVREVLLVQGMAAPTRNEIETAVAALGYSALVVDLGGLAVLYPPLIDARAPLEWTIETAIHEWLHQYLAFTPLGFRYVLDLAGVRPGYEIATMNETVVSMVAQELCQTVLEVYHSGPPPAAAAADPAPEAAPKAPPDRALFNRIMRETRLQVDALLADGYVDEAEAYMEYQRLYLASQGFYIRKLNQAYFAFYGSYADAPTSVDPIGEEMRALRRQVASPREFLDAASTLTDRTALQKWLEAD